MNEGAYPITSLANAAAVELPARHRETLVSVCEEAALSVGGLRVSVPDDGAVGSTAIRQAAPGGTVMEYGRSSYSGRTLDPDLLQAFVSFGSSLEPIRELRSGPGNVRVLIFTASSLSLELEVLPDLMIGQILPPGPGKIRVETPGEVTFDVAAGDTGFFDLPDMPRGLVRLRCDTPAGQLITDWIHL